jgi:hypothetical protein
MIRILIVLCLLLSGLLAYSQQREQGPENDFCNQATLLQVGDQLWGLSNAQATTSLGETPEAQPVTCIKTFENDMWFRFVGDTSYQYYEVLITPRSCATPAGLQALLIEADDCSESEFIYRACVNPYAIRSLKLFLREPRQGQNYFINVDGYDGNICSYDLELIGHRDNPILPQDFLNLTIDYDTGPPWFSPQSTDIRFQNNEALLEWSVDAQEAVAMFLVESVWKWHDKEYGRVVGVVQPQNTVGSGLATYRFRDRLTRFEEGQTYCYRIVKVNPQGEREFGESLCVEARLIEGFSVSEVLRRDQTDTYVVLFTNKKRQDLSFRVFDSDQKFLKGLTLKRVKKGSNQVTVDMGPFPAGLYFLEVEGGGEVFRREFGVEK